MAKAQFMGHPISGTAGAAITRGQLLKADTFPGVVKTAADTDLVIGIALADAASGEQVSIGVDRGVYTVTGTATAGNRLGPDADGKVKAVAATKPCIGYALETASNAKMLILFDGSNSINTTS
jgi:hypothetical protein